MNKFKISISSGFLDIAKNLSEYVHTGISLKGIHNLHNITDCDASQIQIFGAKKLISCVHNKITLK